MQGELKCDGKIVIGSLPAEATERLLSLSGNWLEYTPEENAIIVKHVQPAGCPPLAAIPCELISLLDAVSPKQRAAMPGGAIYIRTGAETLRVLVEHGEVRVQWPHEDYSHSTIVSLESASEGLNPCQARVNGWARFSGAVDAAFRLQEFVDRFEGLYPEGDLNFSTSGNSVYVEFKQVNIGPLPLVACLQSLADPPNSLQAGLEVGSFAPGAMEMDFQIRISEGRAQALRPALWAAEQKA